MQNLIIAILTEDSGFKRVVLSGCILLEDSYALLDGWRSVIAEMYPDNDDIPNLIPLGSEMSMTKLAKRGFAMTDTCNTARKPRRLIIEGVNRVMQEEGLSADKAKVREGDCWQHLRNVWFGAIAKGLNEHMTEILAEDLKELPAIFHIGLDIEDLMRCVEKLFGLPANYAKGLGSEFLQWMLKYHPGAYLYPLARTCGGSRQHLCVEGAPAVLMNLPYYLQFTRWRMKATGNKSDAILATKLFIMLRCSKVVALLCVLSILHIAVCLPTRWLAGTHTTLPSLVSGISTIWENRWT